MENYFSPPPSQEQLPIDLKDKKVKLRLFLLVLGIAINFLVLFYYKYLFWIVSELSVFPAFSSLHLREHALPLGISFFTFHAISYLVDVYQGKVKEHSGTDFATYFFMFPHLVAGPIVRFESVRTDIRKRERKAQLFAYGVFRLMLGLNKKILIANFVAPLADYAFMSSQAYEPSLATLDAWVGMIAYTIQIYYDFSGYSDMAIGLAAMMGIHFDENFKSPYQCKSIREFWRCWHISLSTWLRDYLYIPLGGNRVKKWLNYRNLIIVFCLCGLWHGAAFTFLLWGLFHGSLLIIERGRIGNFIEKMPKLLRHFYCLLAVMFGWVLFRSESLQDAESYFRALFSWTQTPPGMLLNGGVLNLLALLTGILIALFGRCYFIHGRDNSKHLPLWLFAMNLVLMLPSLAMLYTGSHNPFIYFNF